MDQGIMLTIIVLLIGLALTGFAYVAFHAELVLFIALIYIVSIPVLYEFVERLTAAKLNR